MTDAELLEWVQFVKSRYTSTQLSREHQPVRKAPKAAKTSTNKLGDLLAALGAEET